MLCPRHSLVGLALLALLGCDVLDSPSVACTEIFVWGLQVSVQDSVTGAAGASGAQLIARDEAYADTASLPAGRPDLDAQPLVAAGEQPGTYTVTVRKSGYVDWVRSDVVVTADECHVRPVTLTARLKPAP